MNLSEDDYAVLYLIGFFVFFIVAIVYGSFLKERFTVLETAGEAKGVSLDLVRDTKRDVVLVGIHFGHDLALAVTAKQARQLAQWLRIASAHGKTVGEARVNYKYPRGR